MFQNILPIHKKSENDTNNVFFGVNCKSTQQGNKQQLKLDIKCMMSQEVLVMKLDKLDQQMMDIKVEYSLYVDRKYLTQVPYLQQNYSKEEDVVQIIALCSQGIKLPTGQDFHFYFECNDQLESSKLEFKSLIDGKPHKTIYRLLICSIILQCQKMTDLLITKLIENCNLFDVTKILMICIQYENKEYSLYFYQLIISYFLYESSLLNQQIVNPHLQLILLNISTHYIQIVDPDVIIVTNGKQSLKIGTLFFKNLYKSIENRKKKYYQPLQKYQFYKNLRKKSQKVNDADYPHYFKLMDEAEGKSHLVAYQTSTHGEILIFEKEQLQWHKYSDEYVGCVERNFWGTVFQVFDYGYPKEVAAKFPKYFGQERKEIANIQYQTNIMASSPRKFQATMLNYATQKIMELAQLEPVYNEDKDCYQLNFYGRAKRASARNFEVIDPVDKNIIYLLHGKWEKNLFNLDYRYPTNMIQAFSFSLVSVSKKFLVQ